MTVPEANLVLCGLFLLVFAAIGLWMSGKVHSPKDFFHHANLRQNTISLTAANITLGTGLVYQIGGGQLNGVLMLLSPVGIYAGYYLLANLLGKLSASPLPELEQGKNMLDALGRAIEKRDHGVPAFSRRIATCLVITYTALLAFEIYASSRILASFLFTEPERTAEMLVSLAIFLFCLFYTLLGGIRAVLLTDLVQFAILIVFIPVLIGVCLWGFATSDFARPTFSSVVNMRGTVLASGASAALLAIASQFLSLLNWGTLSHFDVATQCKLMKRVGAMTAGVSALFVAVGLLYSGNPDSSGWVALTAAFSSLASGTAPWAYLLCAFLVLGMLTIILTTVDSLIVFLTMFVFDNVIGADSKSETADSQSISRIRMLGCATWMLVFVPLVLFAFLRPDPFRLLLCLASGAMSLAPFIAVTIYLAGKVNGLAVITRRAVNAAVGMFILFFGVGVAVLLLSPSMMGVVGIVAVVSSSVFAAVLVRRARRGSVERAETDNEQ